MSEERKTRSTIPSLEDPPASKRLDVGEGRVEDAAGLCDAIGLDVLVGLVPVLGEIITTAMGAYIIWEARNLGMSRWQQARMGANVLFDTAIGAIPLLGDALRDLLDPRPDFRHSTAAPDALQRCRPGPPEYCRRPESLR